MRIQIKNSNISILLLLLGFLILGNTIFAQNAQESYQKQLLQALNTGNFTETAHNIVNKIQKLDAYEELLKSLLVQPAISVSQKLIVLQELLLFFEATGRWTDVCMTYETIKNIRQLGNKENIQYAIALFFIGDYEKSELILSTISAEQEYSEYKKLLAAWILYEKSYKDLKFQEIIQLTNSENWYIKISALQLLINSSEGETRDTYAEKMRSITQSDNSFYSSINMYMLSLSMIMSQKAQVSQTTEYLDDTSKKQDPEVIILQAGAFSKYENALNFQKKLQSLGIPSKIVQRSKDAVFLVLIYSSLNDFQTITIKLKEAGIEAWITNEP